jgi:hypothetical protein
MPNQDLMLQGLPPELVADQNAIERQQKIAEAMLSQGMSPLGAGRMVGNTFVAPNFTEGLAKLVQAYVGKQGTRSADAKRADIGSRYQQMYADEVAKLQQLRQGSTPRPQQMSADDLAMIADQGGESAPTVQDVKPASRRQITDAMLASRLPQFRQAGMSRMGAEFGQELRDEQPFTLSAGGVRYGADGRVIASAPFKPETEKSFRVGDTRQMRVGRSIVTQEYQADGTWKKIAEGDVDRPGSTVVNNPAPVTPVQIVRDGREIVVDGRTGRVIGDSPKLSDRNKMEVKRQFNMQGIGATIQQAEDLLNGIERLPGGVTKSTSKPTGSGVGAAVDFAGGLVGLSPAGSVQAQQLEAVGGALTAKMPRMEGPQSDKDTMLYKQMAAMVGDRTVPVDRRLAALQTVKDLWAKYERLNPDAFTGGAAADGAKVIDFSQLPK